MRVKTLTSIDTTWLDRKVNEFLAQRDITVVDIRFDTTMFSLSAMIVYEEADGNEQSGRWTPARQVVRR
jgi:hypothetical protein